MLILGLTDPEGNRKVCRCGLSSACGKTNLAMLVPPGSFIEAGWKVETIGDDIAWLKFGDDGRLYAVNPEAGFFGVAPLTSDETNPNALASCRANTLFTNVALLPDNTVWWEGLCDPPAEATDWKGNPWTPESEGPGGSPQQSFYRSGVAVSVHFSRLGVSRGSADFGHHFRGRRSSTTPLVYQARSWQHGTYVGATMTSEKTAPGVGGLGELRHDPMSMLPFWGTTWPTTGSTGLGMSGNGVAKTSPRCFSQRVSRADESGSWLWPGFGENFRVLKWIVDRVGGGATRWRARSGGCRPGRALGFDELGIGDAAGEACWEIKFPRSGLPKRTSGASILPGSVRSCRPAIREENDALNTRLQSSD
ncbi:MAG: hypothetical protein Ct9H300mP1_28140 [Planctomycetaceae bacterium]|nr:MAG: hypothetical protein Ct9H300mP1_28140 [Planctomycetaceae bacterium]